MGRGRRGIPIVIASLAAWGCSLIVDTDGLSDGEEPGDATIDMRDAAVDVRDAANGSDASDAGCAATFCDGFDQSPFGALWTAQAIGQGTKLEPGTPFLSAPNALHVLLDNPPTPEDARAYLSKTFPLAHGFRCDVMMFILKRTTNDLFSDIFRVRTKSDSVKDYVLNLGFAGGLQGTFREDVFFDDGGCQCPRTQDGPPDVEAGRWVHVTLDSDFTNATATFDGVKTTLNLTKIVPKSALVVELGLQGYDHTQAEVLYDDLSCQMVP